MTVPRPVPIAGEVPIAVRASSLDFATASRAQPDRLRELAEAGSLTPAVEG